VRVDDGLSTDGGRILYAMETKMRTGFDDIHELLSFVAIVCCGDIAVMTKSVLFLSWLEEWLFYCEMMYGHSGMRWIDYARSYKISKKVLRRVFKHKLALVIEARHHWPIYATHEEDVMFRKNGWNDFFDSMEPSQTLRI